MKNSQRGFVVPLLIGIIALLIIGGGSYIYINQQAKTSPQINRVENNSIAKTSDISVNTQTSSSTQKQETINPISETQKDNLGWKKYADNSIEFEYPSVLISAVKNGDKVNLGHSLGYKHNDFCDWKDMTVLNKFTDFNVSVRVVDKNLKGALDETQGSFVKDYFVNNTFKLSPGFIDTFGEGSLKGYRITSGAEGCGAYDYYFPINPTRTLVITRAFIPELNPISADNKTYLNLPGVIIPSKEAEIFNKILDSIKVK